MCNRAGERGAPVFAAEDGALLGIHLFKSTVLGVDPTAYGGVALLLVGASLASLAAQDSSLKQALGLARVSGP